MRTILPIRSDVQGYDVGADRPASALANIIRL